MNHTLIDNVNMFFDKNYDITILTNNTLIPPELLHKSLVNIGLKNFDVYSPLIEIKDYLYVNNLKPYVFGTKLSKKYLNHTDSNFDIVVVLYNNNYNYNELCELLTIIKNFKKYIVSHIDNLYPDDIKILPDIGTILNMIIFLLDIKPIKIFGKPYINLPLKLDNKYEKNDIIMIGDNINTDILMSYKKKFFYPF